LLIGELGSIARDEMLRAFNMGAGFLLVCTPGEAERVVDVLTAAGEQPWRIGRVIAGKGDVSYRS
jgi:phosphoribosylformylglycinamidine cyclo-ligase